MSSEDECIVMINRLYGNVVYLLKYRNWLLRDIFYLVSELADVFDIEEEDVQDGARLDEDDEQDSLERWVCMRFVSNATQMISFY